ncbi:COG1361 family protein [Haloplanus natans]|uniref:hypothetical protein n=1 Tax=Haloplanus natans TaxID=376171 RepID=UPI0006780909|nr:hypothetical protein [Haloplanus natans]
MERRALLAGLSAALTGLAGCGSGAAPGTRSTVAPDRPPCADGFRIVDREERIERGAVPEVTVRLHNDGDVTVEYDLRVEFEQATSTGLREPSGRDRIVGTLAPGASVAVTATTDSAERTSTTDYSLDVTLACGSTPADV